MKDFLCLYPYFQWIKLKIGVFWGKVELFALIFEWDICALGKEDVPARQP